MFNTFILLFISLNTINSAELKITKNNDGMFINLFELIEERKQSMFESESINSIKSSNEDDVETKLRAKFIHCL